MDFWELPPMPRAWVEKDYHIFNDNFNTPPSPMGEFPAFSRLPIELRLKIWEESLATSRLINIEVHQNDVENKAQALYTTENKLGETVSNYPYQLQLQEDSFEDNRTKHALLRVNREASRVFLARYRVCLPLNLAKNAKPRELLYSPEHDTLNLRLRDGTPAAALIALIHDTIAHDPKGVGIAHLALSYTEAAELARILTSACEQAPKTSVVQLLTRSLRTIDLVVPLTVDSRNMLGTLSWPHAEIHKNRSLPLSGTLLRTQSNGFSLLESDPRPIERDLSHMAVGTDPRRCLFMWTKFVFHYLGPDYEKQMSGVDVRYLLSISPAVDGSSEYPPAQGREGFVNNFLRVVDYRWADWMHKFKLPPWGERLSEEENQFLEVDVGATGKEGGLEPVAGFWLFPIDSFGDIDEFRKNIEDKNGSNAAEIEWQPKLVKDLSQYQPKLGVFHLL